MNDASGEHVEIEMHAERMEKTSPAEAQSERQILRFGNDNTHLDPSRWWFTSSAFPMVAGTLGPVASAFSICALVRPWRQCFHPGSKMTAARFIPDPKWLIAINAAQLVVAVLANLSLLLNMARTLRFSIAQPVTIVGWYISSICLVVLCATAASLLEPLPDECPYLGDFIWSQAFYYGLYSALLYFVVASLMAVTCWGAYRGHYDKDFVLTNSQRTLMLQTILFLGYLLIGALLFSKLEGWSYLDAVYWTDVTLFTVGFGDLQAHSSLGRALLIPYALFGIISLGLVIGSIRNLVLERGRRRLNARMVEKERRKLLKRMTRKRRDGILEPIREQSGESLPVSVDTGLTELERRQAEFKLMRKVQNKTARRHRWVAMSISSATWALLWLVGAKIFQSCEHKYQGWTYFDGVYFCFVSLTTIGYGDITPISNAGKSFFVFWSLMALPTTTVLISNAGDTVVKGVRDATNQIGNVTILPGEQGFKRELRAVLNAVSFGLLFRDDVDAAQESRPANFGHAPWVQDEESYSDDKIGGRRGAAEENDGSRREADGRRKTNHESASHENSISPRESSLKKCKLFDQPAKPHKTTGTAHSQRSIRTLEMTRAVSVERTTQLEIPIPKSDYLIALIEEIRNVTQHLKSHPPRKYSFNEWAYYLKLIGEDESRADTHRKASVYRRFQNAQPGESKSEKEHGQWSWVGIRSPLMGSKEEAEWVLEKLEERLAEELRSANWEGDGLEKRNDAAQKSR